MKFKNYILLLILMLFVVSVSSVTAADYNSGSDIYTCTMEVGTEEYNKHIGFHDYLQTFYSPEDTQIDKGVYVHAYYSGGEGYDDDMAPHTYKLVKAKFYYKNNENRVITKNITVKNTVNDHTFLHSEKINGYTPYKIDIFYTKMTKKEKLLIIQEYENELERYLLNLKVD